MTNLNNIAAINLTEARRVRAIRLVSARRHLRDAINMRGVRHAEHTSACSYARYLQKRDQARGVFQPTQRYM